MSGTILVAYGTKHGSTREVAEAVAASLARCGLEVETRQAGQVDDLSGYSGVVRRGAIYMGRWHPDGGCPQPAPGERRTRLGRDPGLDVRGCGLIRLRESRRNREGSPQRA